MFPRLFRSLFFAPAPIRSRRKSSCKSRFVQLLERRLLLSAVVWDGEAGDLKWDTAANWSNNKIPTSADDVTIDVPNELITITCGGANRTIRNLRCEENLVIEPISLNVVQSAVVNGHVTITGTLGGSGTVLANGGVNLAGGSINGQLTLGRDMNWTSGIIRGVLNVHEGTELIISGGTQKNYWGGVINNSGNITWSSSGLLFGRDEGVINNLVGGVFEIGNNVSLSGTSLQTFNNSGTLIKSGGAGTTIFSSTFNNLGGVLDVRSGILQLNAGGVSTGGKFSVATGTTLVYAEGSLNGETVAEIQGTLDLNAPATFTGSGILTGLPSGAIRVQGNLLGTTRNGDQFEPQGTVQLDGTGTASNPQFLEVMSEDRGSVTIGFRDNFAYGTMFVTNNSYVRLVDRSVNSKGTSPESLYVTSLSTTAGTTLDLNGFHVYARSSRILGSVTGGTITLLPDGGDLLLNQSVAGRISTAGETDEWTFYGRAGQTISAELNPGASSPPVPLATALSLGQMQILDPEGTLRGSTSSSTSNKNKAPILMKKS